MPVKDFDRLPLAAYIDANRADNRADGFTLFQHIPKTAGSSLTGEMARHIRDYRNIFLTDATPGAGFEARMTARVEQFVTGELPAGYRCASGHLHREHVERILAARPDAFLFTFLREPVARFVSDYRYQCTPMHPGHEAFRARFPTIEDYLEAREGNKMTRFMLGRDVALTRRVPFEDALAWAEETFHFVGIQDNYPLSFGILMRLHGLAARPSHRKRVNEANAGGAGDITPELRARIEERNELDARLFAHFRAKLLAHKDAFWAQAQAGGAA